MLKVQEIRNPNHNSNRTYVVLGSNGTMGLYLSSTGGGVYLPTDILHSGGGTFDIKVNNLRLGQGFNRTSF